MKILNYTIRTVIAAFLCQGLVFTASATTQPIGTYYIQATKNCNKNCINEGYSSGRIISTTSGHSTEPNQSGGYSTTWGEGEASCICE